MKSCQEAEGGALHCQLFLQSEDDLAQFPLENNPGGAAQGGKVVEG